MKNFLLFLCVFILACACADFGNSEKSATSGGDTVDIVERPAKNPFPPGFENPLSGAFTEEKMLVNTGVNVVAKGVKDFFLQTIVLEDKMKDYCETLSDSTSDPFVAEQDAKEQWKKTMLAFHFIEAAPVGPLSDKGRFLSDNLYSWPYFNPCGVDMEVVRVSEGVSSNPQKMFTVRGLLALEYLLFESELGTSCRSPKAVQWAAKPKEVKRRDRCAYALETVHELTTFAEYLHLSWDSREGNFSRTLIDNRPEARYPSAREATNALSDSLFALEAIKDKKLGKTIGRHKDCINPAGKCVEDTEHPWAKIGLEAMEAQLRGFRAVFFGHRLSPTRDNAFGLDDFLIERGRPEVAAKVLDEVNRALATTRTLIAKGVLQDQVQAMDTAACAATTIDDRKEPLCALHQEIRALSTTMKIEVLSVLSLRLPPIFEGDND